MAHSSGMKHLPLIALLLPTVVWAGDFDGDGFPDRYDNCPEVYNELQGDSDSDGVGDVCDGCPIDYDPGQEDFDGDRFGDACDLCPTTPMPKGELNIDTDFDGFGDHCDNCPYDANIGQIDFDGNGYGQQCDYPELDKGCDATGGTPTFWAVLPLVLLGFRRRAATSRPSGAVSS